MLIAVDSNVPLDLAHKIEDIADALEVIRRRIKGVRVITTPTVNLELAYLCQSAQEETVRSAAQTALRSQMLTVTLQDFDVPAPIIATPREIVRKFCN